MMEKRNMVTEDSRGDFDLNKKAEYYDEESPYIASEETKHKLKKPVKLPHKDKNATGY
jgi:hypothetical protein